MTRGHWVPRLLDGYTLYDDGDTGKQCNQDGDCKTAPDDPNLDCVAHNTEKEHADSTFSHTNNHDSSNLAEKLIFDGCEVYGRVTNFREQSAQAVGTRYGHKNSVHYMESLNIHGC